MAFVVFIVPGRCGKFIRPPTVIWWRNSKAGRSTRTQFHGDARRAQQLQQQAPGRTFANLLEAIGTNDISVTSLRQHRFRDGTDARHSPSFAARRPGQIKLGLDLQGGCRFWSRWTPTDCPGEQRAGLCRKPPKSCANAWTRLVSRTLIQPAGENRILIQLPDCPSRRKTAPNGRFSGGYLEFRLVHRRATS